MSGVNDNKGSRTNNGNKLNQRSHWFTSFLIIPDNHETKEANIVSKLGEWGTMWRWERSSGCGERRMNQMNRTNVT